ncbi:alanine-zipper protein [Bacillus thermotolerans]|uniref:Uncharacterized protein n=1 Tax=Bacillus thermotolerans TaxID=1221996 RepID=A0A0F5I005_BACTR|nr:alanine-zipper protein [Bacillus thermotolerans]KKB34656.1 hypothetical protein QY97_02206 [Bacillus thermotolerans]KKB38570.1 hypothetical protein QY95_02568 [Bacillus thermotolerans]
MSEERGGLMTTESFALKMFEEIGGLRGDLKEVSATMRGIDEKLNHMNDKIEDVKLIAKGAAETASIANDTASKSLNMAEDNKEDIERLFEKFREKDKERKADRKETSDKIVKWVGIVVPASIGITSLIVTIILNFSN